MKTYGPLAVASFTLLLGACSPKPSTEARAAPSSEADPPPAMPATVAPAASDATPRPECTQNFHAFDADADQRVSLEEFRARPHAHPDPEGVFRSRDGNADAFLDGVEFCSRWQTNVAAPPGMGMGPGAGKGPGMACEEHFERFDANSDGNVTEQEFIALPHPHAEPHSVFSVRDQDHDGQISKAEFCAPWSPPAQP